MTTFTWKRGMYCRATVGLGTTTGIGVWRLLGRHSAIFFSILCIALVVCTLLSGLDWFCDGRASWPRAQAFFLVYIGHVL